jgi:hypothetical protein
MHESARVDIMCVCVYVCVCVRVCVSCVCIRTIYTCMLFRDRCHYCTFAKHDGADGARVYMTKEEVLDVARQGALAGCTGAYICLFGVYVRIKPQGVICVVNLLAADSAVVE